MTTIEEFADRLKKEQEARYIEVYGNKFPDLCKSSCHVTIEYGNKYAKINVGRSGKYMIILPGNPGEGRIHGIKAYGVIHHKHIYGTLDTINDWNWGGYTAERKVK